MKPVAVLAAAVTAAVSLSLSTTSVAAGEIVYSSLAKRIVTALQVEPGERVLLRYDQNTLGPLEAEVKKQLEAKGAKVESITYAAAPDLAERLARTDIFIWLPAGEDAQAPAAERKLLTT